ncbi:MAG: GNAT family N-acetyltransferase [Herpetosiphonaceae bacterium]|nr:GNAT family N-acetyltransferase [Herpetosiphonaceae bacterium]
MFNLQTLEIATERLLLKVLDGSFAPIVLDYFTRNAAFRHPWSPAPDEDFLTLAAQRQRLEAELAASGRGHSLRLWLFDRSDAQLRTTLGFVSLSNIVRGAFLSCHLGYEIDGGVINRGLMTEALRATIQVAFERLQLHRIEANIIPRNVRSIRVVEKLGFSYEGLSPRYLKINGVWEDHGHHVLLNAALE